MKQSEPCSFSPHINTIMAAWAVGQLQELNGEPQVMATSAAVAMSVAQLEEAISNAAKNRSQDGRDLVAQMLSQRQEQMTPKEEIPEAVCNALIGFEFATNITQTCNHSRRPVSKRVVSDPGLGFQWLWSLVRVHVLPFPDFFESLHTKLSTKVIGITDRETIENDRTYSTFGQNCYETTTSRYDQKTKSCIHAAYAETLRTGVRFVSSGKISQVQFNAAFQHGLNPSDVCPKHPPEYGRDGRVRNQDHRNKDHNTLRFEAN